MNKGLIVIIFNLFLFSFSSTAQTSLQWRNIDSLFQPLQPSVKVYKTADPLDGKPNIAFYVIADLEDPSLQFTTDTTSNRRLTPTQFFQKNNQPLIVVNCTFFSFETNQNLNVVVKDGRLISFDPVRFVKSNKDTTVKTKAYNSAIGISKKRKADVAWTFTDSSKRYARAAQGLFNDYENKPRYKKWKMQTAVGGGPVLLQKGELLITNNEERKFAGNAINDKHPRTAMGYTEDGKLIILVVQGRFPGLAEGATLTQEAQILKDLGCVEALNLDGGGSSCLLVNGKETITTSDKGGQRAVPAVFIIQKVQ
jgi:exopolysaccharide biosynthesis protein